MPSVNSQSDFDELWATADGQKYGRFKRLHRRYWKHDREIPGVPYPSGLYTNMAWHAILEDRRIEQLAQAKARKNNP